MNVRIITDGGADLSEELIQKYHIGVVPLNIHFPQAEYKTGGELDSAAFFQLMKEHKELPKTSSPTPYDFYEEFKRGYKGEPIIVISITSALSSTYDHANIGKSLFLEDYPEAEIEVIDSRTGSAAMALLTVHAARMSQAGESFAEIVEVLYKKVKSVHTFFVLETLENVIKGGRLDRVKGAIASMLSIKLLLFADEHGKIDVLEKVRGTQNALKRLIDQVGEYSKDFEQKILSVAHGNCEEKAQKVVQQILERYPFAEVIFSKIGPVIGTYSGEGAIVLAYE